MDTPRLGRNPVACFTVGLSRNKVCRTLTVPRPCRVVSSSVLSSPSRAPVSQRMCWPIKVRYPYRSAPPTLAIRLPQTRPTVGRIIAYLQRGLYHQISSEVFILDATVGGITCTVAALVMSSLGHDGLPPPLWLKSERF